MLILKFKKIIVFLQNSVVVNSVIDSNQFHAKLLPVALMTMVQLWAVMGSAHHPVSMPGSGAGAAIVNLVRETEGSFFSEWPYATEIDFSVHKYAMTMIIEQLKDLNAQKAFNYADRCPKEQACHTVYKWSTSVDCVASSPKPNLPLGSVYWRYWMSSCFMGTSLTPNKPVRPAVSDNA